MDKVLILKPRLDVSFKRGAVPAVRGPVRPPREHWRHCVDKLALEHEEKGDTVKIVELPHWQFSPELVEAIKPTKTYIPHKQNYQFPISDRYGPTFYMQMVFPWLFQIDTKGWGADASVWPIRSEPGHSDVYNELLERQMAGKSKFEQPLINSLNSFDHDSYIFFPCQIPHDESIQLHSKVSVEEALQNTIEFCKAADVELIIKGHPVNKESMKHLKEIGKDYLWADDINVNTLIAQCAVVCTVNSGVGMEAILHGKPVCTYGSADYTDAAHDIPSLDAAHSIIKTALTTLPDSVKYRNFINTYVAKMFDSRSTV